jgi:uracil-DNA glycosylase
MYKLLGDEWYEKFKPLINSEYGLWLKKFLAYEWAKNTIIPSEKDENLFRCFRETSYNKVKVVIIGESPYPTYVEEPEIPTYDGLAFSNSNSFKISPSLRNILKEVERCYQGLSSQDWDLSRWANQGVFLINAAQTVVKGNPQNRVKDYQKAWYGFMKYTISLLNKRNDLIWMLWGNHSNKYKELITNNSHGIIEAGHPSPLNTTNPFIGSGVFIKCNEELKARNMEEIKW